MRFLCSFIAQNMNGKFEIHVTVHRRHSEGKEPTRWDKICSFYSFLLPQHVWGTNIPIIKSIISEYLPLLGGHTWKATWVVPHWASWSEHCSEAT
jgi:hypothetical protein